ncbi:hypothetical protein ACH5RR_025926 [Cinchona calisaya]|uniref:NADH dehydrogenase subunit 4 n=1 Tax=Cinchona calisaya TaxID=153742 RepID=A0ABD2Z114_9GENT
MVIILMGFDTICLLNLFLLKSSWSWLGILVGIQIELIFLFNKVCKSFYVDKHFYIIFLIFTFPLVTNLCWFLFYAIYLLNLFSLKSFMNFVSTFEEGSKGAYFQFYLNAQLFILFS